MATWSLCFPQIIEFVESVIWYDIIYLNVKKEFLFFIEGTVTQGIRSCPRHYAKYSIDIQPLFLLVNSYLLRYKNIGGILNLW
jgi:hypothetical protein